MVNLIHYLLAFGEKIGYLGIVMLMAVESSFLPLPSELVIPPAAYLAQQGKMNIFLVIFSGAIGSVIGATFNYFLGRIIGQALIYRLADHKIAKLLFINQVKLKKAETFFIKSANTATFVGRLIPGVRHLISIPAGFFKMNFKNFIFLTFSGSFIWCSILALLGYVFGSNQEIIAKYYKELTIFLAVSGCIFLFLLYFRKIKRNVKN
jgi:membrane protein DedA with SNARE-associated domain